MVAPQQVDAIGIVDLQHQDQREHLDAELTAVDVVPQEQVLRGWNRPELLEDPQQVVELAVYVPHDHDGRRQPKHVGLFVWVRGGVPRTEEDSWIILRMRSTGSSPRYLSVVVRSTMLYFYCASVFLRVFFSRARSFSFLSIDNQKIYTEKTP